MNPISVIIIFAGLSEASATSVLPHLDADTRQIYIWFLIAFPSALVLMFFLTLNFNHKALYGPGVFSNKEHFFDVDEGQQLARCNPAVCSARHDQVSLESKEVLNTPQRPIQPVGSCD